MKPKIGVRNAARIAGQGMVSRIGVTTLERVKVQCIVGLIPSGRVGSA
jgi:hypothetical protein